MPGLNLKSAVVNIGPLWEGATAAGITKALRETLEELGYMGETSVLERLGQVLQNPTGYYESKITHHRVGETMVVTDQYVIYGPWLEGTGTRNAPVTSFEGYKTFRLVRDELDHIAPAVASEMIDRFVI